ncbi:MAG: hypothetical protein HZA90_12590 [Verrucomicrobia bacterium]|nr:hypothetical protein [Verrucomicrobiota bacterium]
MPAVSETIVREYFELHGFFVRQQRKFIAPSRLEDDEIDFFVLNPLPQPSAEPLPFVLASADLARLQRAIVVVKGWHTDTFTAGLLAATPEIFRFVRPGASEHATKSFGPDGPLSKILVVPALPNGDEARQHSIDLLKAKGLDAVIPFRTILSDLIEHIEINRNYLKSDLLQVIRILKNYDFFREPQMELFKTKRPRAKDKKDAAG